jgi:predicted aminopeptidase
MKQCERQITGRSSHNEELHNLYTAPNIMRVREAWKVATLQEMRNEYNILNQKPEG